MERFSFSFYSCSTVPGRVITPWLYYGTSISRVKSEREHEPPLAPGIPVNMFTVVFAVGRSIGWITQWSEMAAESVERISRPRWVSLRTLRQRHPS